MLKNLNFLLYHGRRAPYPYPHTLQAHYEHPDWGGQELTLRFHVIDLTPLSHEELLNHEYCAPMELLLKQGRDGKFELDPISLPGVVSGLHSSSWGRLYYNDASLCINIK